MHGQTHNQHFAQSSFVKKELDAGFELQAKETALIHEEVLQKTAFRKQGKFEAGKIQPSKCLV